MTMPYPQQTTGRGFSNATPGLNWTEEELDALRRKMAGNIGLAGTFDRVNQFRQNALPSLADSVGLGGALDQTSALKTGMQTAAKGVAKKALGTL
jgi:hypothetical protein